MPPIISVSQWTCKYNLERAMIVIKIVDVTIAGVLYFGFANMYVISPKKTTAKAV